MASTKKRVDSEKLWILISKFLQKSFQVKKNQIIHLENMLV